MVLLLWFELKIAINGCHPVFLDMKLPHCSIILMITWSDFLGDQI